MRYNESKKFKLLNTDFILVFTQTANRIRLKISNWFNKPVKLFEVIGDKGCKVLDTNN